VLSLEVKTRTRRESIARVLRPVSLPPISEPRRKLTIRINPKESTNPEPAKPPPAQNQRRNRRKTALRKNSVQFPTTLSSNPANSQQPFPEISVPRKVKPSEKCNPGSEHSAQNAPLQANIQPLGATLPAAISPHPAARAPSPQSLVPIPCFSVFQ
jgi:hypothetical protein